MTRKRALLSTIPPISGGVPAMLRAMLGFLDEMEIDSTVAWYEPWSLSPRLSVPLWRTLVGRVASEERAVPRVPDDPESGGSVPGRAIGAWLPELEFTHYRATRPWRQLIAAHDLHLVVSGTAMAGRAFADSGTPFLAWIASDWHGDRKDRVREFPVLRRLLDRTVVQPVARGLERRILCTGRILALSQATRGELNRVAGREVVAQVMPYPIDTDRFRPDPEAVVPGRIGFVGRFDDPRKNLPLFLDALVVARGRNKEITACVIGGRPGEDDLRRIRASGLESAIEFVPYCGPERLATMLRSLDLIAVTAHQEGLGIATLEAMSSGAPVVSTRCGGPEEYVQDGRNGGLSSTDPAGIADLWTRLIADREARARLSSGARSTVSSGYAKGAVREIVREQIQRLENLRGVNSSR
ncbi:MAG: glycosyltransferase family 4 protein [Thermoanaerobaculia bacterium]